MNTLVANFTKNCNIFYFVAANKFLWRPMSCLALDGWSSRNAKVRRIIGLAILVGCQLYWLIFGQIWRVGNQRLIFSQIWLATNNDWLLSKLSELPIIIDFYWSAANDNWFLAINMFVKNVSRLPGKFQISPDISAFRKQ